MWDYFPDAVSTYADDIDSVIRVITYVVGTWLVATYLVFLFFLFSSRKKKGRRAKYIPGTGKQMYWVLVPIFFVMICDFSIDIYNHSTWANVKMRIPETELTVRIVGRQWMWEFIYPGADGEFGTDDDRKAINQLHVKVGAKTKFELTSVDVLHSFSVPVFRLKQDAVPGRVISGWFEATKIGNYDLQCTEICGTGHMAMAARVLVESGEAFEQFLASGTAQQAEEPKELVAESGGSNLQDSRGRSR